MADTEFEWEGYCFCRTFFVWLRILISFKSIRNNRIKKLNSGSYRNHPLRFSSFPSRSTLILPFWSIWTLWLLIVRSSPFLSFFPISPIFKSSENPNVSYIFEKKSKPCCIICSQMPLRIRTSSFSLTLSTVNLFIKWCVVYFWYKQGVCLKKLTWKRKCYV